MHPSAPILPGTEPAAFHKTSKRFLHFTDRMGDLLLHKPPLSNSLQRVCGVRVLSEMREDCLFDGFHRKGGRSTGMPGDQKQSKVVDSEGREDKSVHAARSIRGMALRFHEWV